MIDWNEDGIEKDAEGLGAFVSVSLFFRRVDALG